MASTATPPASRPAPQRTPGAPGAPPSAALGINLDPRKLLLQYWPWLLLAGVVGLIVGAAAHFAFARLAPQYTAQVVFQFTPLRERVEEQLTVGDAKEMDLFIATQVERMISDNTLSEAVTTPAIRNETQWVDQFMTGGRVDIQAAKRAMEDIVSARRIPSTAFGSLRVSTGRPVDAATIANAVAETYLSQLRQSTLQQANDRLNILKRRLDSIRDERRLKEERQANLFSDDELETLNEASDVETRKLEQLLPTLVQVRYSLDQANEQLAQYEEMLALPGGPATPEDVRAEVEEHPIILKKKDNLAVYRTALSASRRKFGPNHREVKRLENQIAASEDELAAERERLRRETFESNIETLRSEIRSLETALVETSDQVGESRQRLRELNALREEYEQLGADINRLADEERDVETRIAEQQDLITVQDASRVVIYQRAAPPRERSFPKWFLVIPAFTLLSVGFTAGLIVLRELLEQRVRGPADLASIPRTRVLGVVPEASEDPSRPKGVDHVVRDDPTGVMAECFRQIRSEILKRVDRSSQKVLLVAGGMPASGATAVAVNLAHSCAAAHRRVLLIDANLRRPTLHKRFDMGEHPGLGDVLLERSTMEDAARSAGAESTLDVLTAGVSPGGEEKSLVFERLNTRAMKTLIEWARERYDVVIIDAPPMIVSSDALLLAGYSDGAVLVAKAMGEKRGLIARIRNQLNDTQAEFLGVIINRVRSSAGGYFRRNFQATHDYQNNGRPSPEEEPKRGRRARKRAAEAESRPVRIESLERQAKREEGHDPHDNGEPGRRED